ncbi:MAG: iron-sulfur cluster assembly accessory protein [Acidobacteria bacterium]|nr:iron-sulfur cluster assembly accessory protein [Acidobacteriota bacterium]
MITLTENAVNAVKQVIAQQMESYAGIRVAVVGGGCSGFQYAMNLEREGREGDQVIEVDGFKVFVDEQSHMYLDGTEIDYVESVHGAGFKFANPNVRSSCGCGESFSV